MTFTAPESATAQQYEVSLTVSDGELSSTTYLPAERESESGNAIRRRYVLPGMERETASTTPVIS